MLFINNKHLLWHILVYVFVFSFGLQYFVVDWEQRKVGECFSERIESMPEGELISVTINDGIRKFSELGRHDSSNDDKSKYKKVCVGDIAYNSMRMWQGASGYSPYEGIVSPAYTVLSPKDGIFSKCIAYQFKLPQMIHTFQINSQGITSDNWNLKYPALSEIEIYISGSLQEQKKIAEFFTKLDYLIALHQCKCRFSHQIRLNDWEQCKLGDVALFNPKEELPPEFEYVDLESVVGTEMLSHRTESKITAPSRAQRLAHTGDLFYQTVRPYQRNNYLYEKPDNNYVFSTGYAQMRPFVDGYFLLSLVQSEGFVKVVLDNCTGTSYPAINANDLSEISVAVPSNKNEAHKIGAVFRNIDNLITLHQCEPTFNKWRISMLNNINKTDLFYEYYAQWIKVYKEGAIRKVTMDKYLLTLSWIKQLVPELKVGELSRITYQQLLNDYAEKHERQTTMDFHHQIKGAILDAVDEGLIERDPTRKAIIKGKTPRQKKIKYLNQFELHKLLSGLSLGEELNWDWFILLVAKTGMRFSEALAITPKDFDFSKQSLSINKTWDYKGDGGFLPTKNQSSVRKIQIDWQLIIQFSTLVKGLPEDKPIFISDSKVYNSTVNDILTRLCKNAEIPVISVHGLRHTHASLLLFAGVSIASVAQRLGHSSMTTTQKTYLHIIQELENKDVDLVMRSLSSLN